MTDINQETIDKIEKEVSEKETEIKTDDFNTKVEAEVKARLDKMEADKKADEEKAVADKASADKEEELKSKLADMDGKQKELEKQLENISLRKSIPKDMDQPAKQPSWEELSNEDKIRKQKEYASSILGMNV